MTSTVGERSSPSVSLRVAVAVLAGALAVAAGATGALAPLEQATIDARFGMRGPRAADDRIAIVALDQKSLRAFDQQLPIERATYAKLLDRVRAARPRLIAIDAQFIGKGPDRQGDRALASSIARNGPVLLATHDDRHGPIPVPAGRRRAAGAVPASVGVQNDPDGVVRRMLFAPVALKTFSVRAAELYTGRQVSDTDFRGNHAWIDFRGPPGTFAEQSFSDVLDGRVPRSAFAGKAVLVGITDPAAKDVFLTAASHKPMAGVELHANALSTILDNFPLQSTSWVLDTLLILLLAAFPAALGARFGALPMLVASLGVLGAVLIGAQIAFQSGWIVPLVPLLSALALSALGTTGVDAFAERRRRRALQTALGRLLPPPSPRAFFISYRRIDSLWPARILRNELAERFGKTSVFLDTTSLQAGDEWPRRVQDAVRGCSVLLVLIGPAWLGSEAGDGERRVDDPDDWVRREIETVLQRLDAIVVPVLLDGARMPEADSLPISLRALTDHQAIILTAARFASDIAALVDSIEAGRLRDYASTGQPPQTPRLVHQPGEATPGRVERRFGRPSAEESPRPAHRAGGQPPRGRGTP